jgi:hypothetical protein
VQSSHGAMPQSDSEPRANSGAAAASSVTARAGGMGAVIAPSTLRRNKHASYRLAPAPGGVTLPA